MAKKENKTIRPEEITQYIDHANTVIAECKKGIEDIENTYHILKTKSLCEQEQIEHQSELIELEQLDKSLTENEDLL